MKKCIISGGAGFIGSHLAEKMISNGWNVTIIDNLSSGSLENLKHILKDITFIKSDVRNLSKLKNIPLKADVFIHLAALVSVNESLLNPQETFNINLNGTISVSEFARKKDIPTIVFASSSAVYGNINKEHIKEEDPLHSISPYGLSKQMAEETLALYTKLFGITTISLRFFNVYGPRQKGDSPYCGVISRFMDRIKNGERPVIYGTGKQTRDFIYVDDVTSAILRATSLNDKKNYVYNVGTGKSTSVHELLETILKMNSQKRKERNVKIIYKPVREGDISFSGANIKKIKNELDFKPKYDIHKGLEKLIRI